MIDVSRKEIKYLVGPADIVGLKKQLGPLMKSDAHNGDNGYRVRSLYFDTISDTDFEDKVDGYDNRQKVRMRIYDTDMNIIKLELKEKSGNAQRKRSLILSREEAERLINADYSCLMEREEKLAAWLYTFMTSRCYRPKCIVEYNRFAFYLDQNDTRVTFDTDLRASELDLNLLNKDMMLYPVSGIGEETLEVKYSGFLMSFIKNELMAYGRMQVSNSKYCRARKITKRGRR